MSGEDPADAKFAMDEDGVARSSQPVSLSTPSAWLESSTAQAGASFTAMRGSGSNMDEDEREDTAVPLAPAAAESPSNSLRVQRRENLTMSNGQVCACRPG